MSDVITILTTVLGLYALVTGVFLISENRRPQSTLAWMLAFIFAPGLGVLVYFFFGRDKKAFSKERRLLRQDLEANATLPLSSILSRQNAAIARLEGESTGRQRLMMLVRRNSYSVLSERNHVEIQQDAAAFYPSLIAAVSDASEPTWRARSLSVYRFWRDLGYAIGALLAGLIADRFGFSTAIYVIAGLTFLSGAIVAVGMQENRTE